MELLIQPYNSKTCGQHCVAMICNISVEHAIALMDKNGSTTTRHLKIALEKQGFKTSNKLIRISKKSVWPSLGIINVKWKNKHGHWVVLFNGLIYDPIGNIAPLPEYIDSIKDYGKLVSFLEISTL